MNKALTASSQPDPQNDIFVERDGAVVRRGGVRLALAPARKNSVSKELSALLES